MIIDVRDKINLKNVKFDENGHVVTHFGNINQQRTNLRPMMKNLKPKIYHDLVNGKNIFHNYGHCGHGWSILFATVDKSIHQFEKLKVDFNEKIVVLGMGIIGLTTAFSLLNLGYKNIEVKGDDKAHTSSEAAGAMINLVKSTSGYSDEERIELNQYFLITYLKYKHILDKKDNEYKLFSKFVQPIFQVSGYINDDLGLAYIANKNYINKENDVTIIYGSKDEPKYMKENLQCFRTFVIDNIKWMKKLSKILMKSNVKFSIEKVNNFNEIKSSSYIFNCTGIGSIELNSDKDLYPSCGHVLNLRNQPFDIGNHYDYGFSIPKIPSLKDESNGMLYCYFKENNTLLGGTSIPNYYGEDTLRNKEELTNIVHRARYFFHGILPSKTKKISPKF